MSRRPNRVPYWLQTVLIFVLLLLIVVVLLPADKAPEEPETLVPARLSDQHVSRQSSVLYEEFQEAPIRPLTETLPIPPVTPAGTGIALIIDDVGYDLNALKRVLALPFRVAVSILPDAPHAEEAARMAYKAGSIVMLHLPMEPSNPKYRARMDGSFLKAGMDENQIHDHFVQALDRVPHVTGMNNHMGSLLTTLEEPMRWVMEICKDRGLFFIDSKTAHNSVAANIAAEMGVAWASRRIFLDHTVDDEDLRLAWKSALKCAKRKGSCIVIAHPHVETLNFLEQRVSEDERTFIQPLTTLLHSGGAS
ncbi:MAG: divergent polysaccharide deacetylase family protein [Mariprofundaceae bacterium]|nr:divergent polysaccharide deacetylase family protein [Mariprofundaceae bacterium]